MPRGRPPKPLEQKRLMGRSPGRDSGGRKLPEQGIVVALPAADGVPDYPADLELAGQQLWDRAWSDAITWLSPASDGDAIIEACRLADDITTARRRYRATGDPSDARALVALNKQLMDALSALGFTPVARTRLGVAEVKRVSALEALLDRKQKRTT